MSKKTYRKYQSNKEETLKFNSVVWLIFTNFGLRLSIEIKYSI